MPNVDIDYYTIDLNEKSMDLLGSIHSTLSKQPLGTALVISDQAIYLLPHPDHKSGFSDVTVVPKEYLSRNRAPSLAELEFFITDELTDDECQKLDLRVNNHELITIKNWSEWLINFYYEASIIDADDENDDRYASMVTGAKNGKLTINDFECIYGRRVPLVQGY